MMEKLIKQELCEPFDLKLKEYFEEKSLITVSSQEMRIGKKIEWLSSEPIIENIKPSKLYSGKPITINFNATIQVPEIRENINDGSISTRISLNHFSIELYFKANEEKFVIDKPLTNIYFNRN